MVTLPRALADEMIAHARSELPNEACGIFGGALEGALRTFYPARNADASPYRYSVDSMDLLRITTTIEDDDERRGRRDLPLAHDVAGQPVAHRHGARDLARGRLRDRLAQERSARDPRLATGRGRPPEELPLEIV